MRVPHPRRLVALLPLTLLIAACGGGSSATTTDVAPATGTETPRSAPAAKTTLEVGGTDLRLGGANADDGSGERLLAGPSRPDAGQLRRQRRHREGVGAGATCADQDLLPTAGNVDQVVASTLCLLNGERADAGFGPLASNERLAQAARAHSEDMVEKSYFSHDAPDGSSSTARIKTTGYIAGDRAWTVGENLAWGTGTLATPRSIVAAWMNSPGHRENILRPVFNEIGFGVVLGNPSKADGQGATYTTTFGSLGSGAATPAPTAAPNVVKQAAPATTTGKQAVKSTSQSRKRKQARARKKARAAKARAAKARASKARASRKAKAAKRS